MTVSVVQFLMHLPVLECSSWSVFSCIQTEYGDPHRKSPYSVQIQDNTDRKKLRIWTLFTQCALVSVYANTGWEKTTSLVSSVAITAQKMKFSIKDFSSKCEQIRRKRQIWSHLLKKSLMENFIFCTVNTVLFSFGVAFR